MRRLNSPSTPLALLHEAQLAFRCRCHGIFRVGRLLEIIWPNGSQQRALIRVTSRSLRGKEVRGRKLVPGSPPPWGWAAPGQRYFQWAAMVGNHRCGHMPHFTGEKPGTFDGKVTLTYFCVNGHENWCTGHMQLLITFTTSGGEIWWNGGICRK